MLKRTFVDKCSKGFTGWMLCSSNDHTINIVLVALTGFVDLEKAFDRVPREVIRWAMHKLGVEEWLVSAVMSMYSGAKNSCKNSLW